MALAAPSDFRDIPSGLPKSWSDRFSSGTRARLPKALVVEDTDDARELFAAELEGAGFVVCQTSSGETALELVRSFCPDVIVLDLMLPGLNGFSVAHAVRTMHLDRSVAILAVTALSSEALCRMALESGCDRILIKPVSAAQVVEEAVLLVTEARSRGSASQ